MEARDAIDWRRLRREVLEPLLTGLPAEWHAFDFVSGARPDGTYVLQDAVARAEPAAIILLDGAYSTRSELGKLIDFSVLVETPIEVRHTRLSRREEESFLRSWHARWDSAEEYYFTCVRPRSAFDLVVRT